ncbi:MAG: hypothetical protein IPI58_09690 [Alphaproteobacteria bacterium]|nr:MAG: hypothetical protein IPI58_09690 [Alphaproteobacteria bacterium]
MTTKFRGRAKRAARQGKEQMRMEMLGQNASVPMRSALDAVTRMGKAEVECRGSLRNDEERRVIQAAREMAALSRQTADSTTQMSSRWDLSRQPTMH